MMDRPGASLCIVWYLGPRFAHCSVAACCCVQELRVDISAPFLARLSLLSFEGAYKKNLPKVNVGDLVFARVTAADKDLDPELSCVDAQVGGYSTSTTV